MICAFFASPNINKVKQRLATTEPSSKRSQQVLVFQCPVTLKRTTQSAYVGKCLDNDIHPVGLGYDFSRIPLDFGLQRIRRIFTTLDTSCDESIMKLKRIVLLAPGWYSTIVATG